MGGSLPGILFFLAGHSRLSPAGLGNCMVTPELYKSSITILVISQTVPQDYVRSTISSRVEQQLATIRQQVLSRTTLTNAEQGRS
jgi:polysaccharide biosynthesis transport protein